jgi:hypothetical protein
MAVTKLTGAGRTKTVAGAAAFSLFQDLIPGPAHATRRGLFSWMTGVAASGRAPHLED